VIDYQECREFIVKVIFSPDYRPTAQILKNLSLQVDPGSSIALVGPSGTLIKSYIKPYTFCNKTL